MPGLFDDVSDPSTQYGLLGAAGAMGDAFTPQPASRLPLARPNMAFLLSRAAGGLGQGLSEAQRIEALKAQTFAQQLQNAQAAGMYNLRAGPMGWPQAPFPGFRPAPGGNGALTAPPTASSPQAPSSPSSAPGMPPQLPGPMPGLGQAISAPSVFGRMGDKVAVAASLAGVPVPIAKAVEMTESGGRQFAPDGTILTSSAGALGRMQLMPDTAKELGVDPKDETQNIAGGVSYLAKNYARLGDWDKAVAAYNPGDKTYGPKVMALARGLGYQDSPQPTSAPAASASGPMASSPLSMYGNPDFMRHLTQFQAFGGNLSPAQQSAALLGHDPLNPNDPVSAEIMRSQALAGTPGFLGEAEAAKAAGKLPYEEQKSAFDQTVRVNAETTIARRKAALDAGLPLSTVDAALNDPMKAQRAPDGKIVTGMGTIVPPPPAPRFMGNKAEEEQAKNTGETEKNFGMVRGALDQTESRMVALANALKIVEGKGYNERRAEIAGNLRGLGLNQFADMVMSGQEQNAVQKAMGLQTLDVLGQLKQINQGTGGRILKSEFSALLDRQYGPDMGPEANFGLLTNALGGVYQTRSMIDDYYKIGKPAGWRDANAYMSNWYSQPENSYDGMVKRAEATIGQLKGMGTPKPSSKLPQFTSPNDAGLQKLMPGDHFLDDKGVERIVPQSRGPSTTVPMPLNQQQVIQGLRAPMR